MMLRTNEYARDTWVDHSVAKSSIVCLFSIPPPQSGVDPLPAGVLAYMQYFWVDDDSLLLFSVLAITIRRWSDKYT